MVVDDVELVGDEDTREGMERLVVGRAVDEGGRLRQRRDEIGHVSDPAAGEQRDVVTAFDQPVGEEGDHPLGAAVADRRNGEPRRSDQGDAQATTGEQE